MSRARTYRSAGEGGAIITPKRNRLQLPAIVSESLNFTRGFPYNPSIFALQLAASFRQVYEPETQFIRRTPLSVTCAYTYDQFLKYSDAENARWREWFSANPSALDVPFAQGRLATIRGLVTHIFAVELRYAERLRGLDVTSYDDINVHALDEIFTLGDGARTLLREYISGMTEEDAAVVLTFPTMTAGTLSATKWKITSNIFLHGIRHWAQVATALRAAGFPGQWGHDMLLSEITT